MVNESFVVHALFAYSLKKFVKLLVVPDPSERYTTVMSLSGKVTLTRLYLAMVFPLTFTS